MRYEKPVVINLNNRAVSGAPEACLSGATPTGACGTGNSGDTTDDDCLAGTTAGGDGASCLSGGSAVPECASGGLGDSASCASGPIFIEF